MEMPEPVHPVSTATGDAVDRSVLTAMSRGDTAVEREFIALYRRLNDEDMVKLQMAVTDGDTAAAVHASHRISGASRMIGAAALAAVGGRIEAASRAADMEGVKIHLPALRLEIARVDAFLNSILMA